MPQDRARVAVHDAHAELRLDPLVPIPDHVVVQHVDEPFRVLMLYLSQAREAATCLL